MKIIRNIAETLGLPVAGLEIASKIQPTDYEILNSQPELIQIQTSVATERVMEMYAGYNAVSQTLDLDIRSEEGRLAAFATSQVTDTGEQWANTQENTVNAALEEINSEDTYAAV